MQARLEDLLNQTYSADEIALIKDRLKEDGRYEKKRSEKSNEKPDSSAELTVQDIFPDKDQKTLRPVIKQGDNYYVIFDELGKGDFGKVKYAINVDNKEIFVVKTQETFELGKTLGEFDYTKITMQAKTPNELYIKINELDKIKNKPDEREKFLSGLYFIYKNMIPFIDKYGRTHDKALAFMKGALPDYIQDQNNITPIDEAEFKAKCSGTKLSDISTALQWANIYIPVLDTQTPDQFATEKDKFMDFAKKVEQRAETELEAIKAMDLGTGEVIKREVDRGKNVYEEKLKDVQFLFLMKYVPGESLTNVISKATNILVPNQYPDLERLQIMRGIVKRWLELRAQGFYHCDLKPDNIKYDRDTGEVKLIDLGSVAKIDPDKKIALTATMGSPGYAAPERGKITGMQQPATEASEVYSIGLIFKELMPEYKNMPLVKAMLDKNDEGKQRPSMDAVLEGIDKLIEQEKNQKEQPVISNPSTNDFSKGKDKLIEQEKNQKERPVISNPSPISKEQIKMTVPMTPLRRVILGELAEISKYDLHSKSKEWLSNFIKTANTKDDIQLLRELANFFNAQCEKYSQPHALSKLKLPMFKAKNKDPIEDVLNKEKNDHYLTRGIGSLLKGAQEKHKEQFDRIGLGNPLNNGKKNYVKDLNQLLSNEEVKLSHLPKLNN